MRGQRVPGARPGVSSPVAAIVIVIVVCGSALGIVELQLSSADSGRTVIPASTVTATVTTTLISVSTTTTTTTNSTHPAQASMAQVSVMVVNLRAADFLAAGTTSTFTCGAAAGSFLALTNTGTAGTSVMFVTLTWTGHTNVFSSVGATCTNAIGAAGSATATNNLLFPTTTIVSTTNAAFGGAYSGTIALSSGAALLFTGQFQ